MSTNQIIATLTELQELKRMQEELAAEIEALQDQVKEHMTATGIDTLAAGVFKVSYKAVISTRFDSTAFKKAMPEVAEQYMKQTITRRFTVD